MRRVSSSNKSNRIKANRIKWLGTVTRHSEALTKLANPGDTILIQREIPRSLVMNCPCGCGETLTVNLDERAGPAWSMYSSNRGLTVYPSVWKETGCRSHFIIWSNRIYWCSFEDDLDFSEEIGDAVNDRLLDVIREGKGDWLYFKKIADRLDVVPWEILLICRRLTANKILVEGEGKLRGHFRIYHGQLIK